MKTLFALFLILCSSYGISQNNLKEKLAEVFNEDRVNSILEDAEEKKYYNNLVFHSFHLEKVEGNKIQKGGFTKITTLELLNNDGTLTAITAQELVESINDNTFNILRLKLPRDFKNANFYLLGTTNHVLKIKSHTFLTKLQKK
ncbi:MAG: hypothetical protein ABF242_03980 [Flavobacteriales bacterium]